MARRAAKANGQVEEKPLEEAALVAEATAEQPKRGRGRPRKERPTNGPSAEQEAETLAELIRLDTESARIAQAKSTVLNRFEKMGGDKKAIKAVKTLLMLDKREAESYLDKLLGYARNAEIKVSWDSDTGQATLSDVMEPPAKNTKGTRDLAAARAHADGFNSGANGAAPSDNPFSHAPGSEEFVSWHDGRDEGAKAREAKLSMAAPATIAASDVPF